jgi:hypothetical protein
MPLVPLNNSPDRRASNRVFGFDQHERPVQSSIIRLRALTLLKLSRILLILSSWPSNRERGIYTIGFYNGLYLLLL